MSHVRRLASVIVPCASTIALTVALTSCDVQTGIDNRSDLQVGAGRAAPALSAGLIGGGRFDLAAHRGHPVVIDFWGPWCGPCRQEQGDLNALRTSYATRGVVFIGVAMRTDAAEVQAYQSDLAMRYPSLLDDGSHASDFNVPAPPMLIVIDSQGRIAQSYLGTVAGAHDLLERLVSGATA